MDEEEQAAAKYGLFERESARMARMPCTYLWLSLLGIIIFSAIGLIVGDFSLASDNAGWWTRGTSIADRQAQLMIIDYNRDDLLNGGDEVWDVLINKVQPGWETDELSGWEDVQEQADELTQNRGLKEVAQTSGTKFARILKSAFQLYSPSTPASKRQSQDSILQGSVSRLLALKHSSSDMGLLEGCDTDWYGSKGMTSETRLWPMWKLLKKSDSPLHSDVLRELCLAEENTLSTLEELGLCFGCPNNRCLQPHGIPLLVRLTVENGLSMNCDELSSAWGAYESSTMGQLKDCTQDLATGVGLVDDLPDSCPDLFYPSLVDEFYGTTGVLSYTSSIFPTFQNMEEDLYDNVESFDKGDGVNIKGVYDTQYESFALLLSDSALARDMALAMGSAIITCVAVLIHTKSCFITTVGMVQIMLTFPMAYFVYVFFLGLKFFPFLNFIGVFVVFALGADHIFVTVDKWKNTRLDHPKATTEHIAALALPDAAGAMLLTTSTTAAAFFGTAICPVAPVKMFAIFCGLLIAMDYIMDVLLIFPALCIYDDWVQAGKKNCCITCACVGNQAPLEGSTSEKGGEREEDTTDEEGEDERNKASLIHIVLSTYFDKFLHPFRWVILGASIMALIFCSIKAAELELPVTADVRVLDESIEYEKHYAWKQNLLSEYLESAAGSPTKIVWGATPADTGDLNSPDSWTQLVLDDTFDPSTEAAQIYLHDFCDKVFEQDFARRTSTDFECPMNRFDMWLQEQANYEDPSEAYASSCAGATGLPMETNSFHTCLIAWAKDYGETSILPRNGEVKIIHFDFSSRVQYKSPNKELEAEWNLIESWIQNESQNAPTEVSRFFFNSLDFWWYDTNRKMYETAYGAAGIALGAAALMILLSSRSIIMTIFAVLSILYVLAAVTASMVVMGWSLGFLESICFAVLIGVSVDFVIHFTHAYGAKQGSVDRSTRTKYALTHMGPSILAAAFTSIAGAMIMLFTTITFFQKFALVLFLTIIHATVGSFIVFLSMAVCLGPSQPTYFSDRIFEACTDKPPAAVQGDNDAIDDVPKEIVQKIEVVRSEVDADDSVSVGSIEV